MKQALFIFLFLLNCISISFAQSLNKKEKKEVEKYVAIAEDYEKSGLNNSVYITYGQAYDASKKTMPEFILKMAQVFVLSQKNEIRNIKLEDKEYGSLTYKSFLERMNGFLQSDSSKADIYLALSAFHLMYSGNMEAYNKNYNEAISLGNVNKECLDVIPMLHKKNEEKKQLASAKTEYDVSMKEIEKYFAEKNEARCFELISKLEATKQKPEGVSRVKMFMLQEFKKYNLIPEVADKHVKLFPKGKIDAWLYKSYALNRLNKADEADSLRAWIFSEYYKEYIKGFDMGYQRSDHLDKMIEIANQLDETPVKIPFNYTIEDGNSFYKILDTAYALTKRKHYYTALCFYLNLSNSANGNWIYDYNKVGNLSRYIRNNKEYHYILSSLMASFQNSYLKQEAYNYLQKTKEGHIGWHSDGLFGDKSQLKDTTEFISYINNLSLQSYPPKTKKYYTGLIDSLQYSATTRIVAEKRKADFEKYQEDQISGKYFPAGKEKIYKFTSLNNNLKNLVIKYTKRGVNHIDLAKKIAYSTGNVDSFKFYTQLAIIDFEAAKKTTEHTIESINNNISSYKDSYSISFAKDLQEQSKNFGIELEQLISELKKGSKDFIQKLDLVFKWEWHWYY